MQNLERSQIPEDYFPYRSHSHPFFHWLTKNLDTSHASIINEDGWFWLINHCFWGHFSIAYFEKCDLEPTQALLMKYGMKRWIVFWSGWRKTKPAGRGWLRFGYNFSRMYHHSTRSAFVVINSAEYWEKWTSGARWQRKKIRDLEQSDTIRIDTDVSIEDFLIIYNRTEISHGWKTYLSLRQQFLSQYYGDNIRIFLAFVGNRPLAGAIFLDDQSTSTYLVAFQDPAGKPYHLWLAIVDRWCEQSFEKGFKYLDFDHMQNTCDSDSYAGYTRFKAHLTEFELQFREVWAKWV